MLVLSVCPVFPRSVLFVYHVLRWRLPSTGSKMLILNFQSLGTIPVSIHPCFMIHALGFWFEVILIWHHFIHEQTHMTDFNFGTQVKRGKLLPCFFFNKKAKSFTICNSALYGWVKLGSLFLFYIRHVVCRGTP